MFKVPPSKDEIMARTRRELTISRRLQFAALGICAGLGFTSAATHEIGDPQSNIYEHVAVGIAFASVAERQIRYLRAHKLVQNYEKQSLSGRNREHASPQLARIGLDYVVQAGTFAMATSAAEYMKGWQDFSFAHNSLGGVATGIGAIVLTFPLENKLTENYLQSMQAQLDTIDSKHFDAKTT
jgi:hypothetical protein